MTINLNRLRNLQECFSDIFKMKKRSGSRGAAYEGASASYGANCSTTNVIELCFVEVRPRTRPMVCFVNVECGSHHLLHFSRDPAWNGKPAPLRIYTSCLTSPWALSCLHVPYRYDNFRTYPGHQEGIRGRSALRKGGYVKLLA
jgi:hypothetical protein